MIRCNIAPRGNWREQAQALGFVFHTINGEAYWVEDAYYQFSLKQIEDQVEAPSEELHQMAMDFVADAIGSEEVLTRLCIPREFWDYIAKSYRAGEKHLYGRMDFAYSGEQPVKLLEFNYDTPTSLYEAAYFQWLWLEQNLKSGALDSRCDQYNLLQELLIQAFGRLKGDLRNPLYLSSVRAHQEDRGTILYLRDCAVQAGIECALIDIEDIGLSSDGRFTDLDHRVIESLFKLYPLEFMFEDEFGKALPKSGMRLFEPPWKTLLSNKGALAYLWQRHPNHPNLLPTYFEDSNQLLQPGWVRKPLHSREGANVEVHLLTGDVERNPGPYLGATVRQAYAPLPRFGPYHAVLGAWIIADRAAGLGIREDTGFITRDSARFVPHVILD